MLTFEKKTSKQPEENKTQTSEINTYISSNNDNQTQNNETKKINLEPTKHTRISECGNTYNIYKAVDLSNENSIPIPKSMPLLQNYMKSLLGEIVKRKSIEYREEEERGKVQYFIKKNKPKKRKLKKKLTKSRLMTKRIRIVGEYGLTVV